MARLIALRANPGTFRPVIELTGKGELLCHELCGDRWFRSSKWDVEDALAQFQGLYENELIVALSNLHELLGIHPTSKDYIFGWNQTIHGEKTMLLETDYVLRGYRDMDEPVLVIRPNKYPEKDYRDYY